jgi:cyclin D1/2/4
LTGSQTSLVLQAAEYHNFGYYTSALAVNLLDRFMAAQPTSDEELWTLQLAAVACLSIAAKMEEGIMPADIAELQVTRTLTHSFSQSEHGG